MAIWINEFHYDNDGGDAVEFIEIAGDAGTDLTGYSLALYNGTPSQRSVYQTINLSGTLADLSNGFGALSFAALGLQNGDSGGNVNSASPDGIALVGPGATVLQFNSYEGSFVAASGPAASMTSVNVGVAETGSALGTSIGLVGTGDSLADFTYALITDDTPGAVNVGQTFTGGGGGETPFLSIADENVTEGDNGVTTVTVGVQLSEAATSEVSVTVSTLDGTATIANGDYQAFEQVLTFAPGETTKTFTLEINGDTDVEPNETFTVELSGVTGNVTVGDDEATITITNDDVAPVTLTLIHDIQGTAYFSPILAADGITAFNTNSTTRVSIEGIVTAVDTFGGQRGFYVSEEAADWDGDYRTSEGIFVSFGGTSPPAGITVGEQVRVTANIRENQAFTNLPTTQLVNAVIDAQSNDVRALPTLVLDGSTPELSIPNRVTSDDNPNFRDSVDTGANFDPETDALDYYETVESMRVTIVDMVVGDGFVGGSNDNFVFFNAYSTAHANPEQINSRGGYTNSGDPERYPLDTAEPLDDVIRGGRHLHDGDLNPDVIELDFGNVGRGGAAAFDELLTMGDDLGDVTGIIEFDFSVVKLFVTDAFEAGIVENLGGLPTREVTALTGDDARSLRVATYNVENLSPVGTVYDERPTPDLITDQARFDDLAADIALNLGGPDIIIVQEIQDNNGVNASGGRAADQTFEALVAAVNAATGKTYSWVNETPPGDTGGAPGGNIQVGFLFDTARVSLGDLPANATIAERRRYTDQIGDNVRDAGDLIAFDDSMVTGINPADWTGTRRSLLGEFTFNGNTVYAVASHLPSKSGSGEPFQLNQNIDAGAPANGDWSLRNALANDIWSVKNLVSTGDADNRVVSGGDFNEFYFYRPSEILGGYANEDGSARDGGTRYRNLLVDKLPESDRFSFDFDGRSQNLDAIFADEALAAVADFDAVHINTGYNDRNGAVNPASSDHDPLLASFDFRSFGERLAGANLDGFGGDDVLTGTVDSMLEGGEGDDMLIGGAGSNTLMGDEGDDSARGGSFFDILRGDAGDDTLSGGNGSDVVIGGDGMDVVAGGSRDDLLLGGADNDMLSGGNGNDVLEGGLGRDRYNGGEGADMFVLTALADSGVLSAARDSIADFNQAQGDLIDLRAIDAMAGGGSANDTFRFNDGGRFSGSGGELRAVRLTNSSGSYFVVQGDVDGDRLADFAITVFGAVSLGADDFLL